MALFVADVQYPSWIVSLVNDVVLPAITPQSFMGHLGYRFWSPETLASNDQWLIHVYPLPFELVGQQFDGQRATSGFALDVRKILTHFDRVEGVSWCAPPCNYDAMILPHMEFVGSFLGNRVELRFTSVAPETEKPTHLMDVQTGKISEYSRGDEA